MTTLGTGPPRGRAGAGYDRIEVGGGDTATPLSIRKRVDIVARHLTPVHRRVLDCGCGAGDYVLELTRRGLDAHGVEYSGDKVAVARAHGGLRHRVARGDLERLEAPTGSFDAALFNEVLEHVPDDRAALREAHRIVRPGGRLLVFSPNRLFPFESHGVALRRSGRELSPATPFVPWVPLALGRRAFDYWARNYWPHELRRLVRAAGFMVIATDVVWQTFENISGSQPAAFRLGRPALRAVAAALEATPVLRWFGVSQVVIAAR